ncbi:MAG: hypothetical protein JW917_03015 [Ignavibacteria bacterium]|nr:hypothetical protein [Ignavibacteria bacterium]
MNTNYKSEIPLKIQIEFEFVSKRIRILAIAIIAGIVIIFAAGLFTAKMSIYPIKEIYNIFAVIISLGLCILSYPVKRIMLKRRIDEKKFMPFYFNALIIPLALCDVGGLFGIVTNFFISVNIIYAIVCFVISVFCIYLVFPRMKDLDLINFEKDKVKVV